MWWKKDGKLVRVELVCECHVPVEVSTIIWPSSARQAPLSPSVFSSATFRRLEVFHWALAGVYLKYYPSGSAVLSI